GSHYEEMYDKRVITERSHFLLATKTHDIQLSEEWCNSLFVPKTELSYIDLSKTNEQIKRYVTAVNLDNIMKICKIIPKKFDGRDSYIGFCKGSIDGETLFFAEAGRLYMMCDDYRMPQTGSYLHIEKMGKNAKGCFVSKWSVISKERGVLKNAYLGGDVLTDLKFKDEECKVLFKYLKGIKRVYLHWKT
ncbi:MAG TPA: hypothetical protein PKD85_10810, partial [Saprospiraceae bacterium]|nr:hypothetical protein [Saprospiraceae bacterium]